MPKMGSVLSVGGLPRTVKPMLLSITVILLLMMAGCATGESFYQRRDHLDQEKYLRPVDNINVVRNITDAEFVLSKYGYLLCGAKRRKREAVTTRGMRALYPGLMEGRRDTDGCDMAEVRKAITTYQRTYNLPVTGKLDHETRSLMSTSRCGNKDSDDAPSSTGTSSDLSNTAEESRAESETSQLLQTLTAADTPAGSVHSDNTAGSLNNGENGNDEDENGADDDDDESAPTHRLWRRSARYLNPKRRLVSILSGRDASKPHTRRLSDHQKFLQDYIEEARREASEDSSDPVRKRKVSKNRMRKLMLRRYTSSERKRARRSVQVNAPHGLMFNRNVIRWRLLNTGISTRIPLEDQKGTITLAFRMWSEVIPLKFVEDRDSDIHTVDIEIAFGTGPHQNCEHDFDGNGGEIAHSFNIGNMHFDDDDSFKSIKTYSPDGIYLLRVAVHEIGHVLGLAHTNKSQSIMYAIYRGTQLQPEFELSRDDRREIQTIYGVCKGSFNTLFDWVRRGPDRELIYNSYFFRGNHYWMYENHANRTRYGDPLFIAREWSGVPDNIDGYVHVWLFTGHKTMDEAYFFKGEYYYKYNSSNDRVVTGWPKLIQQDFGPKSGQSEAIPNDLDSIFFDPRDRNIYFFKGENVYVYDPVATEEGRGCCVRKTTIQEEFPAADGQQPLPSHLDAVYYSYRDKMMYFLKGEDLWKNRIFDPRQRRNHNSIEYLGKWYDKWFDICDV